MPLYISRRAFLFTMKEMEYENEKLALIRRIVVDDSPTIWLVRDVAGNILIRSNVPEEKRGEFCKALEKLVSDYNAEIPSLYEQGII